MNQHANALAATAQSGKLVTPCVNAASYHCAGWKEYPASLAGFLMDYLALFIALGQHRRWAT